MNVGCTPRYSFKIFGTECETCRVFPCTDLIYVITLSLK